MTSEGSGEGVGDDVLGFVDDAFEVGFVAEAFGVDLVEIFGAGGAGGEPAGFGDDLEASDGRVVAGGIGELGGDALAGEMDSLTLAAESLLSLAFCSGVAGASMRV